MESPSFLLQDLLAVLDGIAAFELAESWDNVGVMVGDPAQNVSAILVALDPTEETLQEAVENGSDVLLTHHPLIFHPLKSVRTDQPVGSFLAKALESRIAVVGCHTNLDVVPGGVSDVFASQLGLIDIRPLAPTGDIPDADHGFGRVGRFPEALSADLFRDRLFSVLQLPVIRVAGSLPESIATVAVCGGSGSDLAETAFRLGAQVYITGEVKHSVARWAEGAGICVIDAGHFATENLVVPMLVAALQQAFAKQGLQVAVRASELQASPFSYFLKR